VKLASGQGDSSDYWQLRGEFILYGDTNVKGVHTFFYQHLGDSQRRLIGNVPVNPNHLHDVTWSPDLREAVWNNQESQDDIWIFERRGLL
jgi:hypothetical protein